MSQNPTQMQAEGFSEVKGSITQPEEVSSLPSELKNMVQPKAPTAEIGFFTSIGFALGFSALLFLNTYGITAGLALIFSGLGLWQIKRKGEPGRAYAILGIILALLSLVWLGLQYLGLVTTPGMLFNFIKGLLGFRT